MCYRVQVGHHVRFYKLGGCCWKFLFRCTVMPSSPERESATRDSESSSRSNSVDDIFQRFKTYLDDKVEALSSGLVIVSQTVTETQKLNRAAEAEKLKMAGNKDQFLFNSDLSNVVDEAENFLAANGSQRYSQSSRQTSSLEQVS